MRRRLLPVVLALPLAGCLGGGDDAPPDRAAAAPAPTGPRRRRRPPPPARSPRSPTSDAARERLAYVNLDALAREHAAGARARACSARARAAAPGRGRRDAGTAVQVAAATVLHGDGGTPCVGGAATALAARLAGPRPRRARSHPGAPSAAQSCLGDTLAQTILGPATMGADAALGVGLAESGDAPAGLQLRICGAPRYLRDLARDGEAPRARASASGAARVDRRAARSASARSSTRRSPADARRARASCSTLLAAGPALRALAWR